MYFTCIDLLILGEKPPKVLYLTNYKATVAEPNNGIDGWSTCFSTETFLRPAFIVVCEDYRTPYIRQFAITEQFERSIALIEVQVYGLSKLKLHPPFVYTNTTLELIQFISL